jgi:HEAT repeat protein
MDLASLMMLAILLPGQEPETPPAGPEASPEQQVLKAAHLSDGDSDLLAYFKRRTQPPGRDELEAAIKQLSAKTAAERDKGAAALIGWGEAAVPLLRQAANTVDEIQAAALARECLANIEGSAGATLTQSAAHLLAARRPAGATRLLLAYLPRSEDDSVLEAIETALESVGVEDGKPAAPLLGAVKDPLPVRRTVAVRVLGKIGGSAALTAIRPLLKDRRPTVRMEAAISLLQAHDAESFPVLIELVGDLAPVQREQVETLLNEVAGEWAMNTPPGEDATSRRLRRDLWAAWWRSTSGERLLEEVRARTLSDEDREEIAKLIAGLSDPSPQAREKASGELVRRFGKRAVSLLYRARQEHSDGKARPIEKCLEAVERGTPQSLPEATFRLLALRQPKGTVEALLAYTPCTENPTAQLELEKALAVLGCPDGKPVKALAEALADPLPARRLTAGKVLARAAGKEHLAEVRKLMRDRDSEVRLQVGLELVHRGNKDAVPVLIRLLGELPAEGAHQVEDCLALLAGDKVPEAELPEAVADRGPAVEAWQKWWKANADAVDMASLGSGRQAQGMVVTEQQPLPPNTQGRVVGLDARGKVRWEIGNLAWPNHARVLPSGQVLVVEQQNRLSLRDRKGKSVWDRNYLNIFQVDPLPGGSLFVLCRNQVMVVDRQGKEVYSHPEGTYILGGGRLPNGHSAYFTNQGTYVRLNARGKVVKTAQVGIPLQFGINGLEILPGDRILVSQANTQKVIEYNLEGKAVWEASVSQPGWPHRLANGRTLVPINNNNQIVELDRRGKVVSEKKDLPCRPFRIESP